MVSTRSSSGKLLRPSPPDSPSPIAVNGSSNRKKRGSETNGHNDNHNFEHEAKRQKVAEPVDKTRWRMKADGGRHTWHYLEDDAAVNEWPQTYADKWYMGLPMVGVPLHRTGWLGAYWG